MKIIFLLSLLIIVSVLPLSFAQEHKDITDLENTSLEKIQEKKYDEALLLLDKIIKLDPNNTFAYNNKGAILIEQEKYNESITVLDKSLQINENSTEAWNNKGIAYSKISDYENSLLSFYSALKIEPKNQIAFDNIQKISDVLPLLNFSELGYGILQVWDSDRNLIGSSKIHTIGLLSGVGYEVFKERSKIVEVDGKNYFIFENAKLQTINAYVGGVDLSLYKGTDQIVIGEFKTHGFIARAGNYYTYHIVLPDIFVS